MALVAIRTTKTIAAAFRRKWKIMVEGKEM
jgi:hypothetical protein